MEQDRGLKYANFTTGGDISLSRRLAREDDGGNYTCAITFQNDHTLTSSVRVEVLQSKSSLSLRIYLFSLMSVSK